MVDPHNVDDGGNEGCGGTVRVARMARTIRTARMVRMVGMAAKTFDYEITEK